MPQTQPSQGTLRGPAGWVLHPNSGSNAPRRGRNAEGLKQPGGSRDEAESVTHGAAQDGATSPSSREDRGATTSVIYYRELFFLFSFLF